MSSARSSVLTNMTPRIPFVIMGNTMPPRDPDEDDEDDEDDDEEDDEPPVVREPDQDAKAAKVSLGGLYRCVALA
jgi:hypothetical protein